jgi:hypothetical protein
MIKKTGTTLTLYQKTAIGVWGAGVVLFGAVFLLCYLPQHELTAQVQYRFQESSREAAIAKQAASAEANELIEQQARQALEKLGAFTVSSDRVSSLVFEIGRMADSLKLQGYSSKYLDLPMRSVKAAEPRLLSEAWLSVEFSGSYEQFARFVNLLERNQPAVFVEKAFVTRGQTENENCRFQLELSILATVDPAAAKKESKPN